MTVDEEPFEITTHEGATEGPSEPAERKAVLNAIDERASVRPSGLEKMIVGPGGEGAAALDVTKSVGRIDLGVDRFPVFVKRAEVEPDQNSGAVTDLAVALDDADATPGRRKIKEGLGTHMPIPGDLRRDGQVKSEFESAVAHLVLREVGAQTRGGWTRVRAAVPESSPVGGDDSVLVTAHLPWGRITVSMMWMTAFEASRSVLTIVAFCTIAFPSRTLIVTLSP